MSSRGNLIIISAPSGTGKTSLAGRVLKLVEGLQFSVSHTTRRPRATERDGVEYFFVDPKRFEEMIAQGAFLEWAHVYGNYYGTSREFVESELGKGTDVLLDIDVQGAEKVKRSMPEALSVFVLPPSREVLERRLRNRGLDDEEVIEARLRVANEEIGKCLDYDFLIVNESIEKSAVELQSIVLAARCRIDRRRGTAQRVLASFTVDAEGPKR